MDCVSGLAAYYGYGEDKISQAQDQFLLYLCNFAKIGMTAYGSKASDRTLDMKFEGMEGN